MVVNRQQQQQDPSSSASVSISSAEPSESPRNRCKSESLSVERQSPPAAQTAASALAERAARLSTRLGHNESSPKSPNAAMQAVFRARLGEEVPHRAAPAQGPPHIAGGSDGLEYLSKVELAAMVRQLQQRQATSATSVSNNSRLNPAPDFTPRRVVTGINALSGKSTIVCDGSPPELLPDGRVQVHPSPNPNPNPNPTPILVELR